MAGYGFPNQNSEEVERHIAMQIVDKNIAENLEVYTILEFDKNGVLEDVQGWMWGENEVSAEDITLLKRNGIIGYLKFTDFPKNNYYHFHPKSDGLHHLGGDLPDKLIIPKNDCPNSFQYVGFVSNKDPVFNWLPISLNIIYPIYLGFTELILDYSNEFEPQIINKDEVNNAYSDGILKVGTNVVFEKLHFTTERANQPGFGIGFSGAPGWTQGHQPPICPKSKLPMRFVCQLNSDNGCKVKSVTLNDDKKEKLSHYFEEMQFSVDWQMYIFFQSTSKVACLKVAY